MTTPCTVLILEPGLARRTMYRQALDAGFRLLFAGTALEALSVAVRQRPDLVLLPVRLVPGSGMVGGARLDGVDICRMIKRSPLHATPVILRGDGSGLLETLRARRACADRFLPGPARDEEVREAIGELLSPRIIADRLRSSHHFFGTGSMRATGARVAAV